MAIWNSAHDWTTSAPGNISLTVRGGYDSVTRSNNTITFLYGVAFTQSSSSYTYNSIAAFPGGTRRYAFNSSSGSSHTSNGTWYYAYTSGSTRTSEYCGFSGTLSVSGAASGTTSFRVSVGWDGWTPTAYDGYTVYIPYPAIGNPSVSLSGSSVTTTSAALTFSTSSGTNCTGGTVSTTLNGSTVSGTSPSFSGLVPNTSYSWTATITNDAGLSSSTSGTITTSTPALPTYTVTWDSITRTSARMVMSITDNPDNFWKIHWYNTSQTWVGGDGLTTGTWYYTPSGLTPNTSYTFYTQIVGYSNGADKNYQGLVNRTVSTIGNAPTITAHGCSDPGQTTATMNYSATYDTNDLLSSYKWDYGTTSSYGSTVNNTNSITGLSTHTTYYYKLTVNSTKGYSSTTTGSFITDYATQQITGLNIIDYTTSSMTINILLENPSIITKVQAWVYESDGTTLKSTQSITTGISTSNEFLFEDLLAGTIYVIKGQITTIGDYLSGVITTSGSTTEDKLVTFVNSDGTLVKHKTYILGKGNIYNGDRTSWQNGYYSTGSIGDDITTLLTQVSGSGSAACTTVHLEILPNTIYEIKNDDDVTFIIHGTDSSNIITSVGYSVSPNLVYSFTGDASTTRLWISIYSDTNGYINSQTAEYYKLQVFRSIPVTEILKDNIVVINGKVQYIDICQAGNNISQTNEIIELEVFDSAGTNIALNKTVSVITGGAYSNLDYITNGIVDTNEYASINPFSATQQDTVVRVDLGREYTDIDHIILWRYWSDGRIYNNTRLFGRDATTQLTWKFQSYKIEGTYAETSSGYSAYMPRAEIPSIPYITGITLSPLNSVNTITGTNIIINAEELISIPPVINSLISYRTDAILSANQGRILKNSIGDLTSLTTEEKANIVAAINEIWENNIPLSNNGNTLNSALNAILNV